MDNKLKVRAVPGKLLPHMEPPHLPEKWVGWRLAQEGEQAELTLPRGHGVFDRPARMVKGADGKQHHLPEIVMGREIRLVRILPHVEVPNMYEYRRAIADGDLEQVND